MAISSTALSPKEFRVAIQPQTALGAALTNGMLELNVDSISHGTLGGINNYDLKSGGGRIFQDEHYFHRDADYISEISLSGIYTVSTCFPMLENITGDSAEVFGVPSNYSPTRNIKTGVTLDATSSELLTLAIMPPDVPNDGSPSDSDVILYKDCVVTSFSWSGDMGTDGGLIKYSATFKTRSVVDLDVDGSGYTITPYALSSAQTLSMTDWRTAANRSFGGQADLLVNSFALNLESDAIFLGRAANGLPEAIGRAGEFSATADVNVKYDEESVGMLNAFQTATTGQTTGNTILSNASTPATGASWGFQFPQSVFTSVALSEGDIMNIDASVKMVGYGNGTTTVCATIAD
mgnify:CR=1 FL=1